MDLDTTGKYRCEISGEAPLFQTASRDAILAVVGKYLIAAKIRKTNHPEKMGSNTFKAKLSNPPFKGEKYGSGAFDLWII